MKKKTGKTLRTIQMAGSVTLLAGAMLFNSTVCASASRFKTSPLQSFERMERTTAPVTPIRSWTPKRTPYTSPSAHDDHGDTVDEATPVKPDSVTRGRLQISRDDVDCFRIVLEESGTLTVYTRSRIDTEGTLEGEQVEMAFDDDSGYRENFRISQDLEAGAYYVFVSGLSAQPTAAYALVSQFAAQAQPKVDSAGDSDGARPFSRPMHEEEPYTLPTATQVFKPPVRSPVPTWKQSLFSNWKFGQEPKDDHGDTAEEATAIQLNGSMSGELAVSGDDEDCFKIVLEEAGILEVSTNSTMDTEGTLEDEQGQQLAWDDDSGPGENFRISHELEAGPYYVFVSGLSENSTESYTLDSQFLAASEYQDPQVSEAAGTPMEEEHANEEEPDNDNIRDTLEIPDDVMPDASLEDLLQEAERIQIFGGDSTDPEWWTDFDRKFRESYGIPSDVLPELTPEELIEDLANIQASGADPTNRSVWDDMQRVKEGQLTPDDFLNIWGGTEDGDYLNGGDSGWSIDDQLNGGGDGTGTGLGDGIGSGNFDAGSDSDLGGVGGAGTPIIPGGGPTGGGEGIPGGESAGGVAGGAAGSAAAGNGATGAGSSAAAGASEAKSPASGGGSGTAAGTPGAGSPASDGAPGTGGTESGYTYTVEHTDDGGFFLTVTNNSTGESVTEHFIPSKSGGFVSESSDATVKPDNGEQRPPEGPFSGNAEKSEETGEETGRFNAPQNNSGNSSNSESSNESEESSDSDSDSDSNTDDNSSDDASSDDTSGDNADDSSAGEDSGQSGYCPAEDPTCGQSSSFRGLTARGEWVMFQKFEETRSTLYANGENTGGAASHDPRTSPFDESDVVNPYINPGDSDNGGTDWGISNGSGLVVDPQETVGQTLDPTVESGIIEAIQEDLFNDYDAGALGGASPKGYRSFP